MRTDELIRELAAEARPVRRLSPWATRAAVWVVLALASAAAVVLTLGARGDLLAVWSTPKFAFEELWLLAIAVTAGGSALIISVPGEERSALVRWLPVAAGAAVLFWVGGELAFAATEGAAGRLSLAWHCVGRTLGVGLVPGIVLLMMIRSAAPLRAAWAGMLALLATSAVGVLGTNMICPNDRPLHVLLWHILPMSVLAALGAAVGIWLLSWTRRLRPHD